MPHWPMAIPARLPAPALSSLRLVTAGTISLLTRAPPASYRSRRIRATRLTCGKSIPAASATHLALLGFMHGCLQVHPVHTSLAGRGIAGYAAR
jgi:hypothetical protein